MAPLLLMNCSTILFLLLHRFFGSVWSLPHSLAAPCFTSMIHRLLLLLHFLVRTAQPVASMTSSMQLPEPSTSVVRPNAHRFATRTAPTALTKSTPSLAVTFINTNTLASLVFMMVAMVSLTMTNVFRRSKLLDATGANIFLIRPGTLVVPAIASPKINVVVMESGTVPPGQENWISLMSSSELVLDATCAVT